MEILERYLLNYLRQFSLGDAIMDYFYFHHFLIYIFEVSPNEQISFL